MLERTPARARHGGSLRLACQMTVNGNLLVFKLGVRPLPIKGE